MAGHGAPRRRAGPACAPRSTTGTRIRRARRAPPRRGRGDRRPPPSGVRDGRPRRPPRPPTSPSVLGVPACVEKGQALEQDEVEALLVVVGRRALRRIVVLVGRGVHARRATSEAVRPTSRSSLVVDRRSSPAWTRSSRASSSMSSSTSCSRRSSLSSSSSRMASLVELPDGQLLGWLEVGLTLGEVGLGGRSRASRQSHGQPPFRVRRGPTGAQAGLCRHRPRLQHRTPARLCKAFFRRRCRPGLRQGAEWPNLN